MNISEIKNFQDLKNFCKENSCRNMDGSRCEMDAIIGDMGTYVCITEKSLVKIIVHNRKEKLKKLLS